MITVGGFDVRIEGRWVRTASLADEYYVPIADPESFVQELRRANASADLFTFVQELHDKVPKFAYYREWDQMAVLPLGTYKKWFDKQITFKPRNKIKKAWKSGVETRLVPFSDELLVGIKEIYDETPIRQGKRNWHYHKDLDTLRAEHATFLDRSDFVGAYFGDELIGFAKVTHSLHYSIIMNIVAKVAHRDKAPTNSLIAKTVEIVAGKRIHLLNYGVWGRRGLNEFKTASGFQCWPVPRYYVPLTARGRIALKLHLQRSLKDRLPERWIVRAAELRSRWNRYLHELSTRTAPKAGGDQGL